MKNYAKSAILLLSALALAGPVMAQSSIQCVMGANGVMEAALVWQNSLGVERANSFCRNSGPQMRETQTQTARTYQGQAGAVGHTMNNDYLPLQQADVRQDEYVPLFTR